MKRRILQQISVTLLSVALLPTSGRSQVNTGSTGSDGALDYSAITKTTNIVIDMHDHPTGIYNYTYVNIPVSVTVTFIPNANNTPVYWLVQDGVTITGTVNVSGQNANGTTAGAGGPGGWSGGVGWLGTGQATSGQGPGGGIAGGIVGGQYNYGNQFLVPLLGGSGGAGSTGGQGGGGGGGGAVLIAASASISLAGVIVAEGGGRGVYYGGGGSGGAIRLIASQITGSGTFNALGGAVNGGGNGGNGRIRFDTYDNEFSGVVYGQFSQGFQPIIIPSAGQLPQLTVTSVGGVPVSASPTGVLSTPDAVISAQQNNPIPIVVSCVNLPLNSAITVSVIPMTGSPVSVVGYNNTGTQASSTATVSLNMPRGGGLIYAAAASAK